MYALLRSARLAPKKANLMAKLVRGLTVPDAVEMLRRTHKKSARLVEGVLLSAMANASHNAKQDAQSLIIKEIVVNQGTSLRRGVPMARGRVRPIRKFLCHISVTLGFPHDLVARSASPKKKASPRVATAKVSRRSSSPSHTSDSSSSSQ